MLDGWAALQVGKGSHGHKLLFKVSAAMKLSLVTSPKVSLDYEAWWLKLLLKKVSWARVVMVTSHTAGIKESQKLSKLKLQKVTWRLAVSMAPELSLFKCSTVQDQHDEPYTLVFPSLVQLHRCVRSAQRIISQWGKPVSSEGGVTIIGEPDNCHPYIDIFIF